MKRAECIRSRKKNKLEQQFCSTTAESSVPNTEYLTQSCRNQRKQRNGAKKVVPKKRIKCGIKMRKLLRRKKGLENKVAEQYQKIEFVATLSAKLLFPFPPSEHREEKNSEVCANSVCEALRSTFLSAWHYNAIHRQHTQNTQPRRSMFRMSYRFQQDIPGIQDQSGEKRKEVKREEA
ncbi:hypothetical protein CEXT_528171 [Caerostris extrusa]|uniref:Uncharacterized protein n=1 Tax=Caerostris extrusa TaxID=172846 RepID=A0AAV4NXQ0_CAEEX|nr:hypothetical protein CEXT_528171 [Caerostris extrusa]